MGGEKGESQTTALSREGSPPRGRGKDAMTMLEILLKRITPAWAGKSCFSYSLESSVWDHPRVGGEKVDEVAPLGVVQGSPPRGRGKAAGISTCWWLTRITPAWAGKRLCRIQHLPDEQDHPRVGGEKPQRHRRREKELGSPPRGRGKVRIGSTHDFTPWITPAWAGKSLFRSCVNSFTRDHPRVGGEKQMVLLWTVLKIGSPPRGRGKD